MTWIQTTTGRAFDLLHPSAHDVDFVTDIPEALARIARFTGHIRSGPYSVAQHCVLGAHAILRDTGRKDMAAAFLLHDAHEAYMGDIATPIVHALAAYGALIAVDHTKQASSGLGGEALVRRSVHLMKNRLDHAIHEAAGILFPLPDPVRKIVEEYDLRMLATERRQILGRGPKPWGDAIENAKAVRLTGKISIWPWPKAAEEYRLLLTRLVPTATARAA